MAANRPLPAGRCYFQNLTLKTSDYNTSCQCQTFWLDAPTEAWSSPAGSDDREIVVHRGSGQRLGKDETRESRQSVSTSRYGFCVCGHHACFHDASPAESKASKFNQSTLETDKERTGNSFQTAKQSASRATSYKADDLHASATTIDDNASPRPSNRRGEHASEQRSDWTRTSIHSEGLGLSIMTTRDEPLANINTAVRPHMASENSSATTEVTSHIYFPGGYHHNLQVDSFRDDSPRNPFYSTVPMFQSPRLRPHPQIQRLTPRIQQYGLERSSSTVADSTHFTHPGLLSISRQAMGVVNALNTISTTLLPSHLQNRQITELNSSATSVDSVTQHITGLGDHPYFADEVTRKAMAAEGAARDLLQCIEQSTSQFSDTLVGEPQPHQIGEAKQQSVSNIRSISVYPTIHSPSDAPSSPDSLHSTKSKQSLLSSIPAPLLPHKRETVGINNSFQNQLKTLAEKLEGIEDILEDTANKAELAEDRVLEMENRVVNVEDKVDYVADSFSRHKDEGLFRKRSRDDQDDDGDSQDHYPGKSGSCRKKRKRRRKHNVATEDVLMLPPMSKDQNTLVQYNYPETTIKQTMTTTRTSVTSTSFTSTSSHGSSTSTRRKTQNLLSTVLLQLDSLSTRIAALEFVSAPTLIRPWTVQVIVLPPSIWATWKRKDNIYRLNGNMPRAPIVGAKAWKRLESRGLIKTIDVTGGEARDFERSIRKNFGSVFKTLHVEVENEGSSNGPWEWSPLRKITKQATLRYLNAGEMDKGFWKVDFLRGTCATALTSPASSATTSAVPSSDPVAPIKVVEPEFQEPTHRLWVTNCWTGGMNNASEDATCENTQVSSLDQASGSKKRASSVTSTQKLTLDPVHDKKKFKVSQNDDDNSSNIASAPLFARLRASNDFGGGWEDIKVLPEAKLTQHRPLGDGPESKDKLTESRIDFWEHDDMLDGPPLEPYPVPLSSRMSGGIVECIQSTYRTASRVNDILSDSDTPFPKVTVSKSTKQTQESLEKQQEQLDEQHSESFASQASFYGSEDSPVRPNLDVLTVQTNEEEEPSHTLRPSTLSHDSAPTPKASAATPGASVYPHPKQLKRRLEDLQEYFNENPSLDPSLFGYNSAYECDEERRRESRSPTVEDDPPASLLSHLTGSNYASIGPVPVPEVMHNPATNQQLIPHFSKPSLGHDKAALFDVPRRLTRSASGPEKSESKMKRRSQD